MMKHIVPIGSMVLLYMVTWIPSIYPSHVSIYTIHGSYGVGKKNMEKNGETREKKTWETWKQCWKTMGKCWTFQSRWIQAMKISKTAGWRMYYLIWSEQHALMHIYGMVVTYLYLYVFWWGSFTRFHVESVSFPGSVELHVESHKVGPRFVKTKLADITPISL